MSVTRLRQKITKSQLVSLAILDAIRSRVVDCGDLKYYSLEDWFKAEKEISRRVEEVL